MDEQSAHRLNLLTTLLIVAGLVAGVCSVALSLPWLTFLFAGLLIGAILSHTSAQSRGTAVEDSLQTAISRAEVAELEANQHRDALDDLAEGLEVLIFLTDLTGKIIYANERACRYFQFEDPVGHVVLAVTMSSEVVDLVNRVAETGKPAHAEVNFRHPEERAGIVHVWQESYGHRRLFVTIYDISELRRLERVRSDFVANVSHELRTPMTTIRAMAETIQDNDPADEALRDRYIEKIIREVDRLTHITDDLLALSSVESGRTNKSETDVAETVRAVVQQLSLKAKEKGLVIGYQGPTSLTAFVNGTQLSQVAMNLIDNAINYTAEGEINVSLTSDEGSFKIQVRDTGVGIAQDHLHRVFERFYRVDKGRSRATGGTGLGLAIVKNIAEAHGGTVSAESALHHGSTFTVTMPLGVPNSAVEP